MTIDVALTAAMAIIQFLCLTGIGVASYWIRRTDHRVDSAEKNIDCIEKDYVRRDDYHRYIDTDREWKQRIEDKIDQLLAGRAGAQRG